MTTGTTAFSDEDGRFLGMVRAEIEAINKRRDQLGRPRLKEPNDQTEIVEAIGLALSGGGIRAAGVSLGVLQALNHHNVIRNIDYLSTVSGGGYIGSSLSASMSVTGGEFVFGKAFANPNDAPLSSDISDTLSVGHIRNYSNYLIPAGLRDVVTGAAIIVRGLVANLGILLPVVLLAAAVMIWSNPDRDALFVTDFFGFSLTDYLPVRHFGVTLALALTGLVLFFLWAIYRSLLSAKKLAEYRTWLPSLGGGFLVLLAATFILELQPFVVAGMFDIADNKSDSSYGILLAWLTGGIKSLATLFAPIAAVVMFFRQQLGNVIKSAGADGTWTSHALAIMSKGLVWVAGAAVPLLIWVAFLYLSYWGIINITTKDSNQATCPQGAITGTVHADPSSAACGGSVDIKLKFDGCNTCPRAGSLAAESNQARIYDGTHTPGWLIEPARFVSELIFGRVIERPMWLLYLSTGLLLLASSWLLTPNANSLHRLYRDRLSKAFLFNPEILAAAGRKKRNDTSRDQGRDFTPLDRFRISEISAEYSPYHLINAALNIQGSDYANRRGRNADFFLFSPRFIGSHATEYAPMPDFERAVPELDLATALAISGAAASSNMGANSIRPLTPTLALLNVRLGYWLKNPRFMSPSVANNQSGGVKTWSPAHKSTLYLWSEITGRLYENADEVYLTDGGHIENLGIYQLLRRRCRIIVAVDAEADADMHLPSFMTLQRYARIDLGVRIELPWQPIQKSTLDWMKRNRKTDSSEPLKAATGPHVAIGKIDYGEGKIGYLVYVKSSLTGDESDYVRDYARRYSTFPHESTGDQFFSEEQFEAYRALGFHMMHGALSGKDDVQVFDGWEGIKAKLTNGGNDIAHQVRAALMG